MPPKKCLTEAEEIEKKQRQAELRRARNQRYQTKLKAKRLSLEDSSVTHSKRRTKASARSAAQTSRGRVGYSRTAAQPSEAQMNVDAGTKESGGKNEGEGEGDHEDDGDDGDDEDDKGGDGSKCRQGGVEEGDGGEGSGIDWDEEEGDTLPIRYVWLGPLSAGHWR
ncbi:hypothetical protein GY45DRAFT_1340419 [Cubamyces sp. BRFM 1775]|nr:hypothetical protein GY45DRAFT_1340419 [Cubamyces sp. BRFM 1775]